jgi:hypothetical protein
MVVVRSGDRSKFRSAMAQIRKRPPGVLQPGQPGVVDLLRKVRNEL